MKTKILIITLLVLTAAKVLADLTAAVTPGHTFAEGELPTTQTLNDAANPTIQITGTIGGTNAGIAAGSINGTFLSDNLASSNIVYDGSSPRALVVAPGGVAASQLATNVAGVGLGGGLGTPISNKVDNATIRIVTDTLQVGLISPTNITIAAGYLLGGGAAGHGTNINIGTGLTLSTAGANATLYASNAPYSSFTSAEYVITAGLAIDTNHNLGAAPSVVRWVAVCKTNDIGFIVGDEEPIGSFYRQANGICTFSGGGNSSNVYVSYSGSQVNIIRKDTGNDDNIVTARWRLKCYARP